MTEACLTFRDLTLGYDSHAAVHHLNGEVRAGSLTALVGANGSGKSTLMKGMVGVIEPMSGTLAKKQGASIAYLPQQSELDRSFPARVVDLVSMGLWPKRGLLGRTSSRHRALVASAIAAVGLEGFETRPIDTLSGGQLQRALFARVLVQDAAIILLDEPFSGVDEPTVSDLVELIGKWHREGRTVMVVVHDLGLVRQHFPETLLLARRTVAWGPTADVLRPENLRRASRFDEAWHDDAPWCEPGAEAAGGHRHDEEDGKDRHDRPGQGIAERRDRPVSTPA